MNRASDTKGNQWRDLLYGGFDGTFLGELRLASQALEERQDGREVFAWADPQADGIFAGHVLLWGRDSPSRVEALDIRTGELRTLVEATTAVHVATADAALSTIFYVTVEPSTNRPTGLWMSPAAGGAPARIDYVFTDEPVTGHFKYRLASSTDGSLLAVQANDATVDILDINSGTAARVALSAPMVGFADDLLIGYGLPTTADHRSLLAFEPDGALMAALADEVSSAQIVRGATAAAVAVMRIDPDVPRTYEIFAIAATGGQSRLVYRHDEDEAGPLLARRDRSFLGYEVPPDWVVLVDSFLPFIVSDEMPRDPPASMRPLLLNLRTGARARVGSFVSPSE